MTEAAGGQAGPDPVSGDEARAATASLPPCEYADHQRVLSDLAQITSYRDDGEPLYQYGAGISPQLLDRWLTGHRNRAVAVDLLAFVVTAAAVVALLWATAVLIWLPPKRPAGYAVLGAGLLVLALVVLAQRRARRRPGGFVAAEVDHVLGHRTVRSCKDWKSMNGSPSLPNEARASSSALWLGDQIRARLNTAGSAVAPVLQTAFVEEVVRRVRLSLRDAYDWRAQLGPQPPAGSVPEQVVHGWQSVDSYIEASYTWAVGQLALLNGLRDQLDGVLATLNVQRVTGALAGASAVPGPSALDGQLLAVAEFRRALAGEVLPVADSVVG